MEQPYSRISCLHTGPHPPQEGSWVFMGAWGPVWATVMAQQKPSSWDITGCHGKDGKSISMYIPGIYIYRRSSIIVRPLFPASPQLPCFLFWSRSSRMKWKKKAGFSPGGTGCCSMSQECHQCKWWAMLLVKVCRHGFDSLGWRWVKSSKHGIKKTYMVWSCLANGASFGPSFLKLAWPTTHSCPCHRKVLGRWSFLLKVCAMPGTPTSPSEITCPRMAMCCSSRIQVNLSRLVALAMWMTCWGHCWSRCALRLAHLSHVWTRWGMSWLTCTSATPKRSLKHRSSTTHGWWESFWVS